MNTHPINSLTTAGQSYLCERLTDIKVALEDLRLEPQRGEAPVMERCERILPTELFNELRAYLGAIEQHHAAICDVLYGEGHDLRADGLVEWSDDVLTPLNAPEVFQSEILRALDAISSHTDDANPHGIERPTQVPDNEHIEADQAAPAGQYRPLTIPDHVGRDRIVEQP